MSGKMSVATHIRYVPMYQVQAEILQSVDVEDIESALRGCLLKLQYANASLGPCKEGKSSTTPLCGLQRHAQCSLTPCQSISTHHARRVVCWCPSSGAHTLPSRIT